jgi:DNA invertase Pin-like site-specific DNA recombinase
MPSQFEKPSGSAANELGRASNYERPRQATIASKTRRQCFLGMLGVFAEFETNLRKERQLEGVAKAKAEGKYKGRIPTHRQRAHPGLEG